MDTSGVFIKMSNCHEIQHGHLLRDGDFYSFRGEDDIYDSCSYNEGFIDDEINSGECVWLPRQDQLQEMVYNKRIQQAEIGKVHVSIQWREIVRDFMRFIENNTTFTSMEQLWIAFVMQTLYNKIWDSKKEDWI